MAKRYWHFFGPSYIHLYGLLNIMTIGYAVCLFVDLNGFYLMLNGRENVLTLANFIKIIALLFLVSLSYSLFNLKGMIISLIVIRLTDNLILAFITKKITKLRLNLFC